MTNVQIISPLSNRQFPYDKVALQLMYLNKKTAIQTVSFQWYGFPNNARAVIYSAGFTRLYESNIRTIAGSNTWIEFVFDNVVLNSGTYYIGVESLDGSFLGYLWTTNDAAQQISKDVAGVTVTVYRGIVKEGGLNIYPNDAMAMQLNAEAVNTAPTTPGAFTQPTGELETGDSKVFSVGSSSDSENNLSKYVWEASINGGSFTKIGETPTANITYSVPTAKTLKIRVKAVDTQGLESAYRESSLYTVTKPRYYWSKYNVDPVYGVREENNVIAELTGQYSGYNFDRCIGSAYNYIAYEVKLFKSYQLGATGEQIIGVNDSGQYSTFPLSQIYAVFGAKPIYFFGNSINGKKAFKTLITKENDDYYLVKTWEMMIYTSSYKRGSLIQSGIIAEEGTYPTDGQKDGYWWLRGSRVNQSIAPPGAFSSPEIGKIFRPSDVASIAFAASSAANLSLYEVDYRYGEGSWNPLTYSKDLTRVLTITTDKALKTIQFRVRAKNTSNVYSDYVYSDVYTIEHNAAPTIELNTPNGTTLYERGILSIEGLALEKDLGNVISVKYKIDNYQAKTIDAKVSDGTTPLTFKKDLTFQQGKFFDKDIAITEELDPEIAHTLTIWSEDDQGGKSADEMRTFFVVPNRAPVLTVNPIEPKSGLIDADTVIISGTVEDPENDNVSVSYRLNDSQLVEIYNDVPGEWSFEIPLKSLKNGSNQITIEAPDSLGKKAEETVTINKKFNPAKQKKAVVYWKITTSAGSAKEMFAWIQKEFGELGIEVEISMTHEGEQENFVPMTNSNTAPIPANGTEELEFHYEDTEKKENIILKLTLTREDTSINTAIKMLSGVLG